MIGICIFVIIAIIGIGGVIAWMLYESEHIVSMCFTVIVIVLLCIGTIGGTIWYYNNTESGKRAIKDWKSNTSGGITRTVTVYDINGKEIAKYEGKFDVEYNAERIKFDDEDGKRHIVYYTTGTIIIDEK